ncbi:MAG: MFS transporter, partial [Solirubrobacteraceae bacterium]
MRRPFGDRALTAWTTAISLGSVLPQYLVASLAVSMRDDFALSASELGVATGASFAVAAVVSPMAGRVVEWIGMRRGVFAGAGLVAGSSLGTALFADSAGDVIALMAVNGLGGGIGAPTFAALIAGGIRIERQGMAFGMLTSAPQIAAFAGGLALPLVAQPLGWRAAFVVPTAITAVALTAL